MAMAKVDQAARAERTSAKVLNGVKVLSATIVADRKRLGEKVTDWIAAHPTYRVVDSVKTQSSEDGFHCIALTVSYWHEN